MPGQWWMVSGMTVAASVAMGLGLGTFVTSPQKQTTPTEKWSPTEESAYLDTVGGASLPDDGVTSDQGPAVIRCIGCGPTLTERRFAADMAGMDSDALIEGSRDPVVQDYLAQDYPPTDDAMIADAMPRKPIADPLSKASTPQLKPIPASQGVAPLIAMPTIESDHP